jgi:RNA polymerase sigma factor (sigma-70 family)
MKEKLVDKNQVSLNMALLQKSYPQLVQNVDWNAFYNCVKARLRQFNLASNYSPEYIIMQTIWRWDMHIKKGKQVACIDGWMKLTALRVIQELQRQDNKVTYDPSTLETDPHLLKAMMEVIESNTKDEDNETRQQVRTAMSQLSEDKRELLELRFFQNLSWDEVASYYAANGSDIKVSTLRKRGERALDELRKIILGIVQE